MPGIFHCIECETDQLSIQRENQTARSENHFEGISELYTANKNLESIKKAPSLYNLLKTT